MDDPVAGQRSARIVARRRVEDILLVEIEHRARGGGKGSNDQQSEQDHPNDRHPPHALNSINVRSRASSLDAS